MLVVGIEILVFEAKGGFASKTKAGVKGSIQIQLCQRQQLLCEVESLESTSCLASYVKSKHWMRRH